MPDHRARTSPEVVVWAPGRVNLIGDHTDYTGGLAVPMAIDLGTTITGRRVEGRITLRSSGFPGTVDIPLGRGSKALADPGSVEPSWGRYVAAVASQLRTGVGFDGEVRTTIPIGTGLSSSAALEVAVAVALGADGPPIEIALACQRAEQLASGVPCGVMDQLVSLTGVSGHALLIDFRTLATEPVPVPADAAIAVIHSGEERRLASSAYAERRAQLEAAERIVGPLREATRDDLATIDDDVVRARARHGVSENDRVLRFAAALRQGDLVAAGALMIDAHASSRDDFGASTPAVDALVDRLVATPGVHGARLTGGGFGGCVVALVDPGTSTEGWGRHWLVQASGGARVL
ncbi:MAG: galactokinase [Acidimicrobiales bacterium]